MRLLFCLIGTWLCLSFGATAHETDPAILQISETRANEFSVDWSYQPVEEYDQVLYPRFPAECVPTTVDQVYRDAGRIHRIWTIKCLGPLAQVRLPSLDDLQSDAWVQVQLLGEGLETYSVRPGSELIDFTLPPTGTLAYFPIGMDHLFFGIDHVLFVIGLFLILQNSMALLKAITAFTIAHSMTLAASVMGWVALPSGAIEAVIALSIVFLAREALLPQHKRSQLTSSLPWLVAGGFGLMHGLGFAGALSEIGLPAGEQILALLLFNLGIEFGQIVLLGGLILLRQLIRWPLNQRCQLVEQIAAFAIGIIAGTWTIERVALLM